MLEQGQGMLQRLREGSRDADRTHAALCRRLPPELARQVWGATLKDGTLTVLVHSAAWGTRLRYQMPRLLETLGAELGEPIERAKVKVRAARA